MRSWWRGGLIVTLMLCGIVLLVVGIDSLRTLIVVGKVPSELLGNQVAYTVGAIVLGLTMIIWCLTGGLSHSARTQRSRQDEGER
jgi:uncharacterized membrane protein YqjE